MGIGPFLHQSRPLLHTKAVLFVDANQAQATELHRVFDQRMGADQDFQFPGGQFAQEFAAFGSTGRSGQQFHG